MADWLDEPLAKFASDPGLVVARHEKLTAENGSYIANGCVRTLRAIYNHARKTARSLPADNPASAVDWNAEHRRDTALGLGDLSTWFAELSVLEPSAPRISPFSPALRPSARRDQEGSRRTSQSSRPVAACSQA